MKIAITGASGKTGYRITEEAVKKGYKVRQIIRKNSKVSDGLEAFETIRVALNNKKELDKALKGIDALVIATGAGASSRRSLGTAVFGGMFMATVIGTLFIPSFFQLIQHVREWGKKLLSGNKS